MESNLAKVNVLYTNAKIVDEEQNFNLQKIANSIVEYFYERGNKPILYRLSLFITYYLRFCKEARRKCKVALYFDEYKIQETSE